MILSASFTCFISEILHQITGWHGRSSATRFGDEPLLSPALRWAGCCEKLWETTWAMDTEAVRVNLPLTLLLQKICLHSRTENVLVCQFVLVLRWVKCPFVTHHSLWRRLPLTYAGAALHISAFSLFSKSITFSKAIPSSLGYTIHDPIGWHKLIRDEFCTSVTARECGAFP